MHHYRRNPQLPLGLLIQEIIVDLFAGGGGASEGLEMGLERLVGVAVNHNDDALSMHRVNHPHAEHHIEDVWHVDPRMACRGRPVGWLHASPDCTHHSQAKGGQPRSASVRSLPWVVVKWAAQVLPRVISLENVRQIEQWGPLVAKRCSVTGRVVTLDKATCPITGRLVHRVAEPGERVPVQRQFLVPCKRRQGLYWRRFLAALRALGYVVEHRRLDAANYRAATNRDRLYMVGRRDGQPIVWPEPESHKKPQRGQRRWSFAADHLDFNLPCHSIFLSREDGRAVGVRRPLVDSTCRRIAVGVQRYVLDNPRPFIVPITQRGAGDRAVDTLRPLPTITTSKGGEFMVAAPTLIQAAHGQGRPGGPQRWGSGAHDVQGPLGTIHAGGGSFAIATAWMVQHNNHRGGIPNAGHAADAPLSTIQTTGSQQALATAHLVTFRQHSTGSAPEQPLPGICAGGEHHGLVQCVLAPDDEARALRVAAFLMRYHGSGGQWAACDEPLTTICTRDRLALVTVWLQGEPWVIVDIGLRMLTPAELYACQGFPPGYVFTHGHDGRRFSKTKQVHMCGNSVSPLPMAAIARANNPWADALEVAA